MKDGSNTLRRCALPALQIRPSKVSKVSNLYVQASNPRQRGWQHNHFCMTAAWALATVIRKGAATRVMKTRL
jgi:hypothetical protein